MSLVELAVVVVIIGLLLSALLGPLATRVEVRQLIGEQQRQVDLRDALIGFAAANRRLPCPDNDGDGLEDTTVSGPNNGPCSGGTPDTGFLPYQTLGVPPVDTWGRLYLYRVDADYVLASSPGSPPSGTALDLQDTSGITVQDRDESKAAFNLTTDAAAVIVSLGPNGYGGTDLQGNTIAVPAAPPTLVDEAENRNGDLIYVARARTVPHVTCSDSDASVTFFCEFDDIVTWVPASLLKLRLVEAGVLP